MAEQLRYPGLPDVKPDPGHVDPCEEPRRLGDSDFHMHRHGIGTEYEHTHTHHHSYQVGGMHGHGFHSRYWACSGDDTFGEEVGPKNPSGAIAPQLERHKYADVFIPFVPGMLQVDLDDLDEYHPDTIFAPIDTSGSQYDYWDLMCSLGERGLPFGIMEHDMVAPHGAYKLLLECPEPWCGHNYKTMRPNYETGGHEWRGIFEEFGHLGPLGLVAFKQPAVDWIGLVLRGWGPVTWSNLDTKVYQALKIPIPPATEGLTCHRHFPDAGHLHKYPELEGVEPTDETPGERPA